MKTGFLIYPGCVQLDIMGAHQVLCFPPEWQCLLIAQSMEPVITNEGLVLTPDFTFKTCPELDVVCVPGGGLGQIEALRNEAVLEFLRHQAQTAKWVSSVCTGSLLLAAAGLLEGYCATCHWAFRDQLAQFPGVEVVTDRVVVDRDRITGAGVTSGIDLGLTLLDQLANEDLAKSAQLMMEYAPLPPLRAGTPEEAGEELTQQLLNVSQPFLKAFADVTQEIVASQS